MSLSMQVLHNLHKMLDRVSMTGQEAIAWVEAKNALEAEIMANVVNVPKAPAPVQAAVKAAIEDARPDSPPAP